MCQISFGQIRSSLIVKRFDIFAFYEVVNQPEQQLDDKTRFMAILVTLIGCQGIGGYKAMVPAALNFGVTPVEIKEIVYQTVAYHGIGRVFSYLKATNEVFEEKVSPFRWKVRRRQPRKNVAKPERRRRSISSRTA